MNLFRSVEWLEKSLNRDFEVELTGERISQGGMDEIVEYLPVRLMDEDWDSIGLEPVTKKGRFSRRLSAYIYKVFQVKLDSSTVECIGNIANRYTVSGGVFIARADRELWQPGEFGDGGSCFWGGRKAAPQLIFRHGGAGIKMYDSSRNPLGRAWIVPRLGRGVIFNPYTVRGKKTLTSGNVGEIVTADGGPFEKFGTVRVHDLRNYGYANETIWINNGVGTVIYPGDLVWSGDYLDLRIKTGPTCSSCGELHEELREYHSAWYCPRCWPIQQCDRCGFYHDRNTMYRDGGTNYCLSCFSILSRRCADCNQLGICNRMTYDGGHKYYCATCWTRRATAKTRASSFLSSMANASSTRINLRDWTIIADDRVRISHGWPSHSTHRWYAFDQEGQTMRDADAEIRGLNTRLATIRATFTDAPLPGCDCVDCREAQSILNRIAELGAS